jgi:hypothetical protein
MSGCGGRGGRANKTELASRATPKVILGVGLYGILCTYVSGRNCITKSVDSNKFAICSKRPVGRLGAIKKEKEREGERDDAKTDRDSVACGAGFEKGKGEDETLELKILTHCQGCH